MEPLFELRKKGSRIEVFQENGLFCFSTMKGGKSVLNEYVIRKDVQKFVEFLIQNGYEKAGLEI